MSTSIQNGEIPCIVLSQFDLDEFPDRKCAICDKKLGVGDQAYYRFIEDDDFCSATCAMEADEIDADVAKKEKQ